MPTEHPPPYRPVPVSHCPATPHSCHLHTSLTLSKAKSIGVKRAYTRLEAENCINQASALATDQPVGVTVAAKKPVEPVSTLATDSDKSTTTEHIQSEHTTTAFTTSRTCHPGQSCYRLLTIKVSTDGSRYEGDICSSSGRRCGIGSFVSKHGDTYCGHWLDDKRHGRGVYHWKATGDRFDGEWQRGSMYGHGQFTWANGDSYIGDWRLGRMHGVGTKKLANGDLMIGDFVRDRLNGRAVRVYVNGDRHEGFYVDDRRHGHGVYRWHSGDQYDGEWHNGRMCGFGTKTLSSGDYYTGEWRDDQANGEGLKFFASSGDRHVGAYHRDERCGYGRYEWNNGDRFEGCWSHGSQHGQGTYYFASGDAFKGEWKRGKKHGVGYFTGVAAQQTFREEWDNGKRVARQPVQYKPTRMMKTEKHTAGIDDIHAGLTHTATSISDASDTDTSSNNKLQCTDTNRQSSFSATAALAINAPSPSTAMAPHSAVDIALPSTCTDNDSVSSAADSPLSSPSSSPRVSAADADLCKVCFDQSIDCVLIACGHFAVCLPCSSRMEKCPICRTQITDVLQIYRA